VDPAGIALGDFDGNGRLDVAVANLATPRFWGDVSILLNRPCEQRVVFRRGDTNQNAIPEIGDAVTILRHLFAKVPTTCSSALDVNDDDRLDIADPIGLLRYLFARGIPPREPFRTCDVDLTPGTTSCDRFDACP